MNKLNEKVEREERIKNSNKDNNSENTKEKIDKFNEDTKKTYENILNLLNLDGGLIVSGTPVSKVLTSVNPPALIIETISVKSTVLKTGNSRYPSINVSNGAVSVSQGLPGNLSAVFDNDTMKEIALKLFNGLISVSITNQFTLKVSITSKLSLGKKNYYAKNSIIFEFRIDTARKPPNGNAVNIYPTWEELMTTMNTNIKEYEKSKLTKQEKIALTTLVTIRGGFVFAPLIPTLLGTVESISIGISIVNAILEYLQTTLRLI